MDNITEPVKAFLETNQNYVNDNGLQTTIDVLFFDDNPVLPNTKSHLHSSSLCSDKAVNTPLLSDTCHLISEEAVSTLLPSDTSHLNCDEAVHTSLRSDTSHLISEEAVSTLLPSDTSHLNCDEAVHTSLRSDTSHLISEEAVSTPLPSDTCHLNSEEIVSIPLPSDTCHLNSEEAVKTPLSSDTCHLNSEEVVSIPLPSDTCHLNSEEAVKTPLSSDTCHLNSEEVVSIPLPSDTCHLNSEEAVKTPLSSDTCHLNSEEAVSTSLPFDTCHLNSEEAVHTPLPSDPSHLNGDEAVNTPLSSDTCHLNSEEAVKTPVSSDTCHLNSEEALSTSPPFDTCHLNSEEAVKTPLSSDTCHLNSEESISTPLPFDTYHFNSEEAVKTPLSSDTCHLNSEEAVSTSLPFDTCHLNSEEAVHTPLLSDPSHLNGDEAVNTPLPSDTSHLNSEEAVSTPLPSDTCHLNSEEAVIRPLPSDTSHLNSEEAVSTPLPSDTCHLNSEEAVIRPLSSDTCHLNSEEAVSTLLPFDTCHLNSEKAVHTPLLSDPSHLNGDEAVNTPLSPNTCHLSSEESVSTPLPSDTCHLNSEEAVITPLSSDTCHLSSEESVSTPLPSDTCHLNSEEAVITPLSSDTCNLISDESVNTPLPFDTSNLNSEEAVNVLNTPSLQDSLNKTGVDVFDSLLDKPATTSTKQIEHYKIGDIVWAKIGKYPYWPSIVCLDPTLNIHYKEKKRFLWHVRFCNDKGRRSWATTTECYYGKCELLSKYPNCLSYFKNSKKLVDTWNLAVKEADNLMKLKRELRMIEFFKSFSNSDSVAPSVSNKSSEDSVTALKVRTYSRKRSLTIPEHGSDSKKMKTENIAENCSSSKSIDISLLSRSDDADSTVSDFSMSYTFMEDLGLKAKQETVKKRRSTKTYPPKSSVTNKYDLSYSIVNSSETNDSNSVSDNQDKYPLTTTKSTRSVPNHRKLEISILEGEYDQDNIIFPSTRRSKKKNTIHINAKLNKEINSCNGDHTQRLQSSSSSKKTVTKKKRIGKENSTGRKSTTIKRESSPEPDTTESEASSKNETYSSVFLTSSKHKQLFTKTWKRACVVCKNIKDTVKCLGPCQSYFHKECLNKSEERYTISIPMMTKIKIKKTPGRRKRHNSKITHKNESSIDDNLQLINNIKEENTAKLLIQDNIVKSNGLRTLSQTQCSNYNNEETIPLNQIKSDEPYKNDSCILTENETQSEFESVNEDPIRGRTVEKNVTPIVPIDEKILLENLKYMCSLCKAYKTYCFVCSLVIDDPGQKISCKISSCGKYFHETCLQDWPQCQWIQGSRNNVRSVICPHHVCHLCISDNPKSSCKTHFPAEKITRCIKCPTAYHRSEYCLPAGCQVLTYNDIICSRHFEPVKVQIYHYNATWCFICAFGGGSLVYCDLCPSSFHIGCLNQDPSEFEGGFTCEECQTGRYPLYGEIVWVKIGNYRWWPAQIIFPNEVPDTVNAISHSVGQFAVRFFGTYDYYWVNRGRVFNFHEGDDQNILRKNNMKVIDKVFQDSILEAAQAHNAYILEREKNDAIVAKSFTKPPKFTRIKFNKPIGNVKNMEFDITTMTPCECDPTKPNPCGPGSDCINRMLMFECEPKVCPAGDKCNNQRFEKTLYPAMVPFLTKGRGWGLKTLEDIKEGSFVIEYVGDVIDEEEFQRRCLEMHQRNEQNYYFLTIDNSRTIDAGPKGNLSRFMNHSCEPNCVTQKWTVNGDTRIGLFALHDIPTGTELVFDYRLQSCSGVEKKPCQCGATRCSKFIGVKVEEEKKKVISSNDVDKCKVSSKNKRKPLKLKDVSDSDKLKLSKVISNDQNISTTENKVTSNAEKIILSKKSKSKTSTSKPSTALKNANSDSSETPAAVKRKWKNSARNIANMTKDDVTVDNSAEFEENVSSKGKLRNGLSTLSSRKLPIKDDTLNTNNSSIVKKERQSNNCKKKNLIKRDLLPLLSPIPIKISASTSYSSEKKGNDIKPEKSTRPQEKSRKSLTRQAKSRHLFLSKNDMSKETKVQPVVSNIKFNKGKKNLSKIIKKSEETLSRKTLVMKKTKINKGLLLSKAYYKNNSCLICGKGHTELSCKNKKCPRVFHLSCINKTRIVKSGFICPSHFCSLCNKRKVVAKCKFCIESFCAVHAKGNIFKDPLGNGMLCTTHHPNKKCFPIVSNPVIPDLNSSSKLNIINNNAEPIDFVDPSFNISISEDLEDIDDDSLNINIDGMNEEEYTRSQVVKDECDREYIHIGGFNVCNMSDLVSDRRESYIPPRDTDGDLFKPSLANVVIDIESASALYQPMDNVQLVSIATDNKDSHDYANVNFITDTNQSKNKWLAAEP